jgi:diacylglycerol kinase family enzyme
MPGMKCWTGAFANASGRANIEQQLMSLQKEFKKVEVQYQEVTLEKEREAAVDRAARLAKSSDDLAKQD